MAVGPDSVAMLLREMNRDFTFYEDLVTFLGLFYAGKLFLSIGRNVCKGVYSHFVTKLYSPVDLAAKYGKWAVVTGGSDGIGKSYAHELARRNVNIILIARNLDKLKKVASEIEEEFGVETKVIVADFGKGRPVYEHIARELKGIDVGILVNNVGVILPYPMAVEEMSDDQMWDHINVNCAAVTVMTRMLLKSMKEKKRGAIINLSSISGLGPTPFLSIYGASKAFVDSFSDALCNECKGTGVTVQTLTPGYINTQMVKYSPNLTSGGLMVPSAQEFAANAIATLGVNNKTAGYWCHGIEYWFFESLPIGIWKNACSFLNRRFRKKYDEMQSGNGAARKMM
ncbi:hydroxysteroid dehydrogenase-like protein 1 [Neocloeon triangulifer]|uniref:hydroxysteroid dehydrogenase-like protein 1 n=1 Tax=Neocloeon triangulifer TaxID=2078957 RepID=UPI00286EDD16|nr:hydroxysteroid dehydrogenase-like protein 1 [Neocloeon triangulifer]